MFKSIFIYTLSFGVLFFLGYFVHDYILEQQGISLDFSLFNVYLFHALFSFVICTSFQVLSQREKIYQQLGFIYLGTLLLKMVVFSVVFYKPIISQENLTKFDSATLLIPLGIFLITEVYFVAKILNKK